MKTILELNEQWWYRLLKVSYGLFIFLISLSCTIILFVLIYDEFTTNSSILIFGISSILSIFVVSKIIQKVFYYVVLGNSQPPQK